MSTQKSKYKLFGLTEFAVDNSTSVFLLTIMMVFFGLRSYVTIPKEQFPEASLPTVYINTPYFGNSAEEIENLISRPLEKEIENINGIKNVNSTSIQDFSVIIAEFDADLEMEAVVRKVKDAVDKAKQELPNDLTEDPTVLEINFSEIPIMTINVSGNYNNDDLKKYAEYLQDKVEGVKQISKVDLKGALEREVNINVDLFKMQSLQVSFGDIENAVSSENLTMSGGEIVSNDFKRALRVVGQFTSAEQIQNLIVKSENQRPIVLKDIATVVDGYKDRSSYARSDGLPVISLDVIKRRGQNLLDAADNIKKEIEIAKPNLPKDLKISIFNDQSVNTRNEVNNLENSIISGVILVTLILLFFLGLRNANMVGLAIPISMLLGIMILNLMGVTLNIVVLFGLILALGMLVDNSIVAVENMYRYVQNGYSPMKAARYGVGEIAVPIISSTATTLAAFIPLGFWPGIMGEFMKYFPITLIIVLSSSLFVALVVNPVVAAKFMKIDEKDTDPGVIARKRKNIFIMIAVLLVLALLGHISGVMWMRNLMVIVAILTTVNYFVLRPVTFKFQETFLPAMEKFYDNFIRFSLQGKKPVFFLAGTFGLLIFSILLLGIVKPKVEFFPVADPIYINAFVELPMGSDIEATNRITKDIESKIETVIKDKRAVVEAVLTQIGENTSDPNQPPEPGVTPNKARVTVSFVPASERGGISTTEVMSDIREVLKGYAGVEIVVDKNADGPPAGKPVNLEVRGENIDSLIVLSETIRSYIKNLDIAGIEELKADIQLGKPELLIHIDREAARRYELSTYSIASALRTSVFGKEISKFKDGEDEYPIVVKLDDKYRNNVEGLLNQKITFRNPANGQLVQVPVSAVADIEYSSTYSSIKRKDKNRVLTVYSNVLDGYNANEIVAQLKEKMLDFPLPDGFTYAFTGQQEQQAEDMGFLTTAFMVAVFLIFLILVSQFNSIVSPFIIILSVLFSTIGVFLGYSLTGTTISVIFSGVGIISLAGIVVNNAIVLIDYTKLLTQRKLEEMGLKSEMELPLEIKKEVIVEAGATRLRPVLLTAITTVLGLVPLAIGFNFNFFTFIERLDGEFFLGGDNTAIWGPMAWTVIYGLTFATFLTLIIVPVMYWLSFRSKRKIFGILRRD
ncbi:MAG: efflux RND transporter permease subunit [Saprospiraceae bacterium]|nr:efflux RND transporter permease subunit [Saprospiraceae bacterium]MBK8371000.1 efflux RND transporter permease subunit [Saprospiraceae bacterium]MBK8854334.1 efflux RND transporter permease subunit [Saprospiraceae bacterium]